MGIDAQTFSRLAPQQLFGRAKGRRALDALEKQARAWSQQNELGPFFSSTIEADNSLSITILPTANAIDFTVSDQGIAVSFRTSNTGPGYHAAVIDLLDALAQQLRLEWQWGSAGEYCTDETNFALQRDFSDLQSRMANFLRQLMGSLPTDYHSRVAICIPSGLGLREEGIACPLGVRDLKWAEYIVEADDEELLVEAKNFFPWWERERSTRFWLNTLRGTLWQNVQWRAPVSKTERRTATAVEYIAQKLENANEPMPSDVSRALSEYRVAMELDQPPAREGIGYRRREVAHSPFTGWQLSLPGYLIESTEDDGTTVVYHHASTVLRVSSLTADKKNGKPFNWPSSLREEQTFESNNLMWRKEDAVIGEDGSFSQFTLVVHDGETRANLLLLTFTSDCQGKLGTFDEWLANVRFRP